jgi:N-acetyl sugar amidotransferase
MGNKNYQICNRCVMDTSDEDIVFDSKGICNHCTDYLDTIQKFREDTYKKEKLDLIIKTVKEKGKGKAYDCIMGISGGVDSCYAVHLAVSWGLRPLLMHMDNGWNKDIAVKNIKTIVEKLNLDYVSEVLDWNEFREIQLAFFKSSIVDLEMPTDVAILASIYKHADKHKIKSVFSGGNYSGEGILPLTWGYHVKKDMKLYQYIVDTFSNIKIKKTPVVGLFKEMYYKFVLNIKTFYPLNYIDYNKDDARAFLIEHYGWQDYGGKHHESTITAFWQSYAMPTKYNMDYRRATFSSQICNNQITREEAIEKLKSISYDDESIDQQKAYVAKKYKISLEELEGFLVKPPKTYKDFPNQKKLIDFFYNLYLLIFKDICL